MSKSDETWGILEFTAMYESVSVTVVGKPEVWLGSIDEDEVEADPFGDADWDEDEDQDRDEDDDWRDEEWGHEEENWADARLGGRPLSRPA